MAKRHNDSTPSGVGGSSTPPTRTSRASASRGDHELPCVVESPPPGRTALTGVMGARSWTGVPSHALRASKLGAPPPAPMPAPAPSHSRRRLAAYADSGIGLGGMANSPVLGWGAGDSPRSAPRGVPHCCCHWCSASRVAAWVGLDGGEMKADDRPGCLVGFATGVVWRVVGTGRGGGCGSSTPSCAAWACNKAPHRRKPREATSVALWRWRPRSCDACRQAFWYLAHACRYSRWLCTSRLVLARTASASPHAVNTAFNPRQW